MSTVKLSDRQLKQLKTADKNKKGATLKMSVKMSHGNDLPRELLLTKLRNAFNNNTSTDLMLSKAQISKTIQSEEFLVSLLIKLASL